MAKRKDDTPPAVEDVTPVGDPGGDAAPPAAPPDPKDAEIAALKAMLADRDAEIERAKAAGGASYPAGQKFLVSLTGGCAAVVQPRDGEHPFECYKRLTGVINSVHAPEVRPAPADAKCGVVRHDGTARPFPAA